MKQTNKLAIIGGTGLYKLNGLNDLQAEQVKTPYGEPSALIYHGNLHGHDVLFLARHGEKHHIPPHKINYRANIWALKSLGVGSIIAVAATGGIHEDLQPRDIVIPSQLIDYTYAREHTFFDGQANELEHVDFSHPYDRLLREYIISTAAKVNLNIHDAGIYAVTQGPRLETVAEIDRLERDGGTIVGMTGMPEAVLARELGIKFAVISLVVNPAAGRGGQEVISLDEIYQHIEQGMKNVHTLLHAVIKNWR